MTAGVATSEVERFRGIVARRLGLRLEDDRLPHLAQVLRSRADACGGSRAEYLDRLAAGVLPAEARALAVDLTVNETYFFRHVEQFEAFADVVLAARAGRLRVLSAGCASGEEPYTIAMVARDSGREVSITGVDVDPVALRTAERGVYSGWALRATPGDLRRRWFRPEQRGLRLDEDIRAAVRFVEHSLTDDNPDLWRPDSFDAVFCRNVLMYFTPEAACTALSRLTEALTPGGHLFLGHAETLRGLCDEAAGRFEVRHTHGTFYYQRTERPAAAPAVDWAGAIAKAADRIHMLDLVRAPAAPVARTPLVVATGPEVVLDLLRGERFAEALRLLEEAPAVDWSSPADALVVHAVLLTHGGMFDRAEALCHELLDLDGLNATAHYLLGACCEARGELGGCAEHYRTSAFLDPGFAMPRLRLGLLARQRGDTDVARRELGRAARLLAHEDARRLLLFGGGFTRDALVALCRAELIACGGVP
jgi:chemotaxis protein methyltransferase CheR